MTKQLLTTLAKAEAAIAYDLRRFWCNAAALLVLAPALAYAAPQARIVGRLTAADRLITCAVKAGCSHVYDMAAALSPGDLPRFEDYMSWIMHESDVDVRFVFLRNRQTLDRGICGSRSG